MPKVHQFESTHEAYDATQYRDAQYCAMQGLPPSDVIEDGDVLVIASEGVIGILNRAWPIAVVMPDGEPGALHKLAEGVKWEDAMKDPVCGGDYRESMKLAIETAVSDADITGNAHWAEAKEPGKDG